MATGTAFSDVMENDILERYLRNVTTVVGALPATVFVGLGTAGVDQSIAEPVATRAYTRKSIGFGTVGSAAGTITAPTAVVTFDQCTGADWGTISHFAIYDASATATGKMLFWGALGSTVQIAVNDKFEFATGAITITVD